MTAVPADIDERAQSAVAIPEEHDRHVSRPCGTNEPGPGELAGVAGVLPGAAEDALRSSRSTAASAYQSHGIVCVRAAVAIGRSVSARFCRDRPGDGVAGLMSARVRPM